VPGLSGDRLLADRGAGFKLHNTALNQNLTWTIGWFSDFFVSGNSTRDLHKQFTGRVTGTPVYEDDGRKLVHLGIAYRHAEATSATGFVMNDALSISHIDCWLCTGSTGLLSNTANLPNSSP
jgi:hypothetical protein